jgi:hypothetical protein
MERAIRRLLLLLWTASLGCAADYAERYRLEHPDWTPARPVLGDSLGETLASIHAGPGAPAEVSVPELRVLRVDVEPWETLSVESALAGPEEQIIGVIAHRRCKGRQGLHFFGSERTSWYVFAAGKLTFYDHFEFGEACEARNYYLPSDSEYLATERTLVRYAVSRYPEFTPTTEEKLSRGMALVAADRLPDAERMLKHADREIGAMLAKRETLNEDEKKALDEREKQLQAMRVKLSRAIADARRQQKEAADGPDFRGAAGSAPWLPPVKAWKSRRWPGASPDP